MRLSVVIPTFNRRDRLARVLEALDAQWGEVAGGFECIVVDDGSEDGTATLLREAVLAGRLRALSPGHGGPARARNAGARAAAGEILVFLGDDTEPQPGFLLAHDRAHRESGGPRAVLGYTGWDEARMRVTPLLRHLNERGLQFGFSLIADPENVPFNFFYASNVSLPRETFLAIGGFDETFPFAAWEDVEFAYRARRAAAPLGIVYRPEARARHDHPLSVPDFRKRQRLSGLAGAVFVSKHPEMGEWLGVGEARLLGAVRPLRLSVLERAVRLADEAGLPLPGRAYDKLFRWDYLAGLREGLAGGLVTAASGERDASAAPAKAGALH
jgi:GT2 family glycosyltransferase